MTKPNPHCTNSNSVSRGFERHTAISSSSITSPATQWSISARPRVHLRDAGHDEVADHIRDEILPCGVLGGDRWTYELVESFETGFLRDIESFERATREDIADGERHIRERRTQREWQERAEE